MLNLKRAVIAASVAAAVAVPGLSHAAALPHAVQNSMSMSELGFVSLSQNYVETGTSALGTGGTLSGQLDKETGTIYGLSLTSGYQGDHFGLQSTLLYASGDTNYDGHYLSNGAPAHGTTTNKILNWNLGLNYGFSFARLPNLAIIPGIVGGLNVWDRGVSDGNTEVYYNAYYMGQVDLAYAVNGHLVVDAGVGAGKTAAPHMHSSSTGYSYTLQAEGISQEWVGVKYLFNPHFALFAKYQNQTFKYGKSNTAADGTFEPDSKTTHGIMTAGLGWRF